MCGSEARTLNRLSCFYFHIFASVEFKLCCNVDRFTLVARTTRRENIRFHRVLVYIYFFTLNKPRQVNFASWLASDLHSQRISTKGSKNTQIKTTSNTKWVNFAIFCFLSRIVTLPETFFNNNFLIIVKTTPHDFKRWSRHRGNMWPYKNVIKTVNSFNGVNGMMILTALRTMTTKFMKIKKRDTPSNR